MLIKTCTDNIDYNKVISEWRSAKQRRIHQSSYMAYKTLTSMRDCVMKRNFM